MYLVVSVLSDIPLFHNEIYQMLYHPYYIHQMVLVCLFHLQQHSFLQEYHCHIFEPHLYSSQTHQELTSQAHYQYYHFQELPHLYSSSLQVDFLLHLNFLWSWIVDFLLHLIDLHPLDLVVDLPPYYVPTMQQHQQHQFQVLLPLPTVPLLLML